MEDLSLHILDIAENSVRAGATRVEIRVCENGEEDRLSIRIADDGRGMSAEMLAQARDAFFTTRTERRVGLGLPLLEQAARATGGRLEIDSAPGAGTQVLAVFGLSHLDRQPLGDMAGTLLALAVGHPQVEFTYLHQRGDWQSSFSTAAIRAQLSGRSVSSPQGIAVLRQALENLRQQTRE